MDYGLHHINGETNNQSEIIQPEAEIFIRRYIIAVKTEENEINRSR